MHSNCGWAQLIDLRTEEPVARGRVFVSRPAGPAVTHNPRADWRGEMDLMRPFGQSLVGGTYGLWFEGEQEQHVVGVGRVEAQFAPSGIRAHATLRSVDGETPPSICEQGGEE